MSGRGISRRGAAAAALVLLLAGRLVEAKPPTLTCDPGFVPECVQPSPTPTRTATRTPTAIPPTKTPTPAPTATPAPSSTPTAAPTATTIPTAIPPVDTTPPTGKILSPLSGAVVPAGSLQVTVEAQDDVGVAGVRFLHNGTVVGTKNVAPFITTYQNVQPPAATIGAYIYDAAGNTTFTENNIQVVANFTPTPGLPSSTPTPTPAVVQTPTQIPTTGPTLPPAAAATPIPPQKFVDTTLPTITGTDRIVNSGQSLQAALDAAVPGDAITLQAGATFTGKFMVRVKAQPVVTSVLSTVGLAAPKVVWIRSGNLSALPEGKRITPADVSKLARIQNTTTEPVLVFELGASNYRLSGLEIASTHALTTATLNSLVWLGINPTTGSSTSSLSDLPDNVIFDRVYLHGTKTGNLRRGITANAQSFAVIDSTFDEIHEEGADSQAVGAWSASGPVKLSNNHFEASGEVIMWGGADTAIQNLTPSDFVIDGNEFEWPSRWQAAVSGGGPASPDWDGSHWSLKNLFEMKHAQRMLIRHNTFRRWWASGQACPIMLTVRNQNGGNPWATVRDLDFQDNKGELLGPGTCVVNIFGADSPPPSGGGNSQQTVRVRFVDNLFQTPSGLGAFRLLGFVDSMRVEHNTILGAPNAGGILALDQGHGPNTNLVFRDNIGMFGKYGIFCSNQVSGDPALNICAPGNDFRGNAMTGPYPTSGGATPSQLSGHPGNYYPADQADLGLDPATHLLSAGSKWKGKGTDGTDPGIITAK